MRGEPTFSLDISVRNGNSFRNKEKLSFNNSLFSSSHYCVSPLYLLVLVTAWGLFRPTFANILELSFSTAMFNVSLIMNIEPPSY
jgi:hypothetical protein